MTYIIVACLGGLGALLRMLISSHYAGAVFPWGTLIVNVVGSFFIGIYYGQQLGGHPWFPPAINAGITIGFLGALTTFSTFSLDTIRLLGDGQFGFAAMNVLGNLILSLTLCYAGIRVISFLQVP